MPDLFIPNAYELYVDTHKPLSVKEVLARVFYDLRFIWLLHEGDVILLSRNPMDEYLDYVCHVRQINRSSLNIIVVDNKNVILRDISKINLNIINQLKMVIKLPDEWNVVTCYFNKEMVKLAEMLTIPVNKAMRQLVANDLIRQMNSKIEFRMMSDKYQLPIPQGIVCASVSELVDGIAQLIPMTRQLMAKQALNASGKGNIGLATDSNQRFNGAGRVYLLSHDNMHELAQKVWHSPCHHVGDKMILEVYYPNKGTYTVQRKITDYSHNTCVTDYSEIMMQTTWGGVTFPPDYLEECSKTELLMGAEKYFDLIQSYGFRGYLSCDAILLNDGRILFTEINMRPGAETHAYELARCLCGDVYDGGRHIVFRRSKKTVTFRQLCSKLSKSGLLFSHGKKSGIVILTADDAVINELEYLVIAQTKREADYLESRLGIEEC